MRTFGCAAAGMHSRERGRRGCPGSRLADPVAHEGLLHMAHRDAAGAAGSAIRRLESERGRAVRVLLRVFERGARRCRRWRRGEVHALYQAPKETTLQRHGRRRPAIHDFRNVQPQGHAGEGRPPTTLLRFRPSLSLCPGVFVMTELRLQARSPAPMASTECADRSSRRRGLIPLDGNGLSILTGGARMEPSRSILSASMTPRRPLRPKPLPA